MNVQGSCEVEIDILDRNDNSPVFTAQQYVGEVMEHSEPGTTVYMVI